MHADRIRRLNYKRATGGKYVLYWMQRSQRAEGNLAIDYAIERANESGLPVLVVFCLAERYPDANARHFAFMLEGLDDVARGLAGQRIGFTLAKGSPPDPVVDLARDASIVVCDRGYLRHLRRWREGLASRCDCPVVEVEDNAVVPVSLVSTKREYAARTIRPKIHRHLERFLSPDPVREVDREWENLPGIEATYAVDCEEMLGQISVNREASPVTGFRGGRVEALNRLDRFISEKLRGYAENRSDPSQEATSTLSPYLHFGHVGPGEIVRAVVDAGEIGEDDRDTLIEELVVRRELAINFVTNEPRYDEYGSMPSWARETLEIHRSDERKHVYSIERLESGDTHDPYWNAAMEEMRKTGFMQNYMRMYWGKKILEWTEGPEEAYYVTLYLNNKYFLDGRDPNSYAGVGWIFGLHDRPWKERPIFGTVRYMNANGLRRKFDIDRYVTRVGTY